MRHYVCILWTALFLLSMSLTSCEGIFENLFPDDENTEDSNHGDGDEDLPDPEENVDGDIELLDQIDPDFMYSYKAHQIEFHIRSNAKLEPHIQYSNILNFLGNEGETYRFELSENDRESDRSSIIHFQHPSGNALEIEIRQEMHPILISNSHNDQEIDFHEQEITIKIIHSTNADFSKIEIESDVDWISMPEKIMEDTSEEPDIVYSYYKYKIAANPSTEERTGTITFSYPEADRYASASITQAGRFESSYESCTCTYQWHSENENFAVWLMKLVPQGVCTPEQPELEFYIYTEYDKVNPNHLELPTGTIRGVQHNSVMGAKDKINTFDTGDVKINGVSSSSILNGSTLEIYNYGNDEYEVIMYIKHYETGDIQIYYQGQIEFKDEERISQLREDITWDAKWSDFSVQWIDNKGEAYSSYKMTLDDTQVNGKKLVLYLAVPKQDKECKTLPEGTYQILNNSWSHSLGIWAGYRYYIYEDYKNENSWYYDTKEGIEAPIAGGTMTVTNKPNSYCNLEMDLKDDFEAPFSHSMVIQYEGSLKISY